MHFFNPPQLLKLVEVVRGAKTSDETVQTVLEIAHQCRKKRFWLRRIAQVSSSTAYSYRPKRGRGPLPEGVADRDDIDKAVRLGVKLAHGPLMLLDYIGADTTLAIAEVPRGSLTKSFSPIPG